MVAPSSGAGRWSASDGDGPEIPTLAAALLPRRSLPAASRRARAMRGASSSWSGSSRSSRRCRSGMRRASVSGRPPLYARVIGDRFEALPPTVRAIHRVSGDAGARGEAQVVRGANPLARPGRGGDVLPPGRRVAAARRFRGAGRRRDLDAGLRRHRFASSMSEDRGRLVEQFGPIRFGFDLPSDGEGLEMKLRRWSLFGLPLPLALAPKIVARRVGGGRTLSLRGGCRDAPDRPRDPLCRLATANRLRAKGKGGTLRHRPLDIGLNGA